MAILLPALILLFIDASAHASTQNRPDLEVVLMVDGGIPAHYFLLRVGFEGEVEGAGDLNPGLPAPPQRLSVPAHVEIGSILDRERFFDSPNRNLGCAPDVDAPRVIKAWRGTKLRSVSFCLDKPGLPLREVQSVLRMWYGVLTVVAGGKGVPVADLDRRLLAKKP
jgi:hypothetical protein